jgi:hypothetical protein
MNRIQGRRRAAGNFGAGVGVRREAAVCREVRGSGGRRGGLMMWVVCGLAAMQGAESTLFEHVAKRIVDAIPIVAREPAPRDVCAMTARPAETGALSGAECSELKRLLLKAAVSEAPHR